MSEASPRPALSLVVPSTTRKATSTAARADARRAGARQPVRDRLRERRSRDGTLARLGDPRGDPNLRIVDLDAFREAAALSAGFAHARGDVVVTLDGDGQNGPAEIPRLLARLGPDVDVVSGRRRERKEAFWSRVLPSRIANALIVRATGVPVHDCGCGLKAYRRSVLAGAQLPRGMNRFLPAILGVNPAPSPRSG
jgi:glycosyltransferase involved in cell wall biosynthesis